MVQAQPLVRSTRELLARHFGVEGTYEELSPMPTAGTAEAVLFHRDASRLAIIVVNLSANIVTIRPNGAASATAGIRLDANGGFVILQAPDDLLMPTLEWHVFGSVDGSTIYAAVMRIDHDLKAEDYA